MKFQDLQLNMALKCVSDIRTDIPVGSKWHVIEIRQSPDMVVIMRSDSIFREKITLPGAFNTIMLSSFEPEESLDVLLDSSIISRLTAKLYDEEQKLIEQQKHVQLLKDTINHMNSKGV